MSTSSPFVLLATIWKRYGFSSFLEGWSSYLGTYRIPQDTQLQHLPTHGPVAHDEGFDEGGIVRVELETVFVQEGVKHHLRGVLMTPSLVGAEVKGEGSEDGG